MTVRTMRITDGRAFFCVITTPKFSFYSSKELLRNDEERRREEQNEFLEQEQGDEVYDPEMDEWEKQQILKAVSRHTVAFSLDGDLSNRFR